MLGIFILVEIGYDYSYFGLGIDKYTILQASGVVVVFVQTTKIRQKLILTYVIKF